MHTIRGLNDGGERERESFGELFVVARKHGSQNRGLFSQILNKEKEEN